MPDIDLDAILAAEAEAKGESHKVTFKGEVFTIPRTDDWPAEWMDLMSRGQVAGAMAGILGDEWERFYGLAPTSGVISALLEAVVQSEGFANMGEASGFGRSLPNGGKRSKRTSSGSTK